MEQTSDASQRTGLAVQIANGEQTCAASCAMHRVAQSVQECAWSTCVHARERQRKHLQLLACRRCTVIVCASTGLFYSTSTGKTADIAEIMKEKLPDAEGPFEVGPLARRR